ncbi:uncharacterized protein [Procambarus clarkii]|uniref:uncharacterized protein isoform X3 n=1 Tax=Procambarus clarkii TaxID=6728 RepID=UPI0037432A91
MATGGNNKDTHYDHMRCYVDSKLMRSRNLISKETYDEIHQVLQYGISASDKIEKYIAENKLSVHGDQIVSETEEGSVVLLHAENIYKALLEIYKENEPFVNIKNFYPRVKTIYAGITKAYTEEFAKTYKLFETTIKEERDALTPSITIEGKVWGKEEISNLINKNEDLINKNEDLQKKLKTSEERQEVYRRYIQSLEERLKKCEETVKEHKQCVQTEHSLKERLKKYETN